MANKYVTKAKGYEKAYSNPSANVKSWEGSQVVFVNSEAEKQQYATDNNLTPSGSQATQDNIAQAQQELAQDIQNKVNPPLTTKEVGTGSFGKTVLEIQSGTLKTDDNFYTVGNQVFASKKGADMYIKAKQQEETQNQIKIYQEQMKTEIPAEYKRKREEYRRLTEEIPNYVQPKVNETTFVNSKYTDLSLPKVDSGFKPSGFVPTSKLPEYKEPFTLPQKTNVDTFFTKSASAYEQILLNKEKEYTTPIGAYKIKQGTSTPSELTNKEKITPISFKDTVISAGAVGGLFAVKRFEGFKDVFFHPIRTVKGGVEFVYGVAFEPVQTVKGTIEQVNTPTKFIGTAGYLGGQMKAFKTLGKAIPEKQVGLKASEFDILKVVRKGKDGKLFTETQVIFKDVEMGKPKTKWFWQGGIKVKENIFYEGIRTTKQLYDDFGYTKTQAVETGKININNNRINLPKSPDVIEIGTPERVIDTSISYTGTTREGISTVGKTKPIQQKVNIQQYLQQRKAYTQNRITNTEVEVGKSAFESANIFLEKTPLKFVEVDEISKGRVTKGYYDIATGESFINKDFKYLSDEKILKLKAHENLGHKVDNFKLREEAIKKGFIKMDNGELTYTPYDFSKINPKTINIYSKKPLPRIDLSNYKISHSNKQLMKEIDNYYGDVSIIETKLKRLGYKKNQYPDEKLARFSEEYISNPKTLKMLYPKAVELFEKVIYEEIPAYEKYKYPYVKETTINIPESIKPKAKVLGTILYKSNNKSKLEPLGKTGILQADIITSGKFVKRPVKPKSDIFIKKSINNKRDVNTIFEKPKAQENLFEQQPSNSRQQVITETITKSEQKTITQPKKVIFAVESKPMFRTPQVLVMPQLERQNLLGANQNSIMFGKLNLNQKSDSRYASMYRQNNKLDTALNTRFNFKPIQVSTQSIKQIPTQKTIIGLESRQSQEQQPIQMLRQPQIQRPVTVQIITPIVPTYKPPIVLPIFQIPTQKNASGKEQGYNVYMKEYGKRVKANTEPLPRMEAERLGMDIADNSLSASFIVTKVNQNVPSARRSNLAQGFGDVSKFMFSKKRTGWVNERNSKRLDTFGEKQGITASKLIAQRKGNMFSSNNKNIFKR